jgi:hypothetical protein
VAAGARSDVLLQDPDKILGPIIHGFAKKWEAKNRPCFTRRYGPDDYRLEDPSLTLTADDWQRLSQGRALLFVHGTFSSAGAFATLQPDVMNELSRRYGGRMFAYNHPTMTADPKGERDRVPSANSADVALDFDIVCHSRGGLVAREIAALEQGSPRSRRAHRVRRRDELGHPDDRRRSHDRDDRSIHDRREFYSLGTRADDRRCARPRTRVIGHGFLHDLQGLAR